MNQSAWHLALMVAAWQLWQWLSGVMWRSLKAENSEMRNIYQSAYNGWQYSSAWRNISAQLIEAYQLMARNNG
jgi:hypothetical protein